MKLVCINRKWQRFESKGLEPDHARVPPFPLQIHAQKDECRDWGPGRSYQVLSCLSTVICTFLVNKWTFFFTAYILIAKVVLHPPIQSFLSALLAGMGAPFRLPGPGQAGVPMPMPGMALPPGMMPPGGMRNFAPVHYPSQDPTRMGANDGAGPSKPT